MRRSWTVLVGAFLVGCAAPAAPPSQQSSRMSEGEVRARVAEQQGSVQWSPNSHVALSQAVAIVQSYETFSLECEIGLKVYGKGRLPRDKQDACAQSLAIGLEGSQFRQGVSKLTEISKEHPEVDAATLNKGIRSATKAADRWLFIRHQLIGR
jgi:hypothetical protein